MLGVRLCMCPAAQEVSWGFISHEAPRWSRTAHRSGTPQHPPTSEPQNPGNTPVPSNTAAHTYTVYDERESTWFTHHFRVFFLSSSSSWTDTESLMRKPDAATLPQHKTRRQQLQRPLLHRRTTPPYTSRGQQELTHLQHWFTPLVTLRSRVTTIILNIDIVLILGI